MIVDVTARYPVANVPFRPVYSIPIAKLVIHHLEMGNLREGASQAEEIDVLDAVYAFHVNVREWGGVGYHGIAFRSGRSYITADWHRWGAHTYRENDDSRGFAVAGGWSDAIPPLSLRQSMAELVARHDGMYGEVLLTGHRDWVATTCPGNPYKQWVPQLRELIEEDDMDDARVKELIGEALGAFVASRDPGTLARILGDPATYPDLAHAVSSAAVAGAPSSQPSPVVRAIRTHAPGGTGGLKRGDSVTLT